MSVDESGLSATDTVVPPHNIDSNIPPKRASVKGAGPIARETARRIACDCSLSINTMMNGEPVDIGRKSRIGPNAMARIIRERDQQCVWPGCTQTHHLHIRHIRHWADGGATSVQNGACLCSSHHTLVHEGGYTLQRIENNDQRLHEQFVQQQHAADISQFDVEKELRSDKKSFNTVRALLSESYRFRIVNAEGEDIGNQSTVGMGDYIRVECGESVPDYCFTGVRNSRGPSFSIEEPARYADETRWNVDSLCY